ncbi:nuclear transport factor 2 family protein [Solicola sp. PLA-1-18]|uniref:nuclear transport factor 2 family protein n=1 Tax=Solicola sp. PLA-1-18 TaxID=3380532 RepID=UPI003B7EDA29
MYHVLVRRLTSRIFDDVNRHRYDAVLRGCAPDVHHRFGGHHALGGERHDSDALARWFDRLGRLVPDLHLTVDDVWVKGWPRSTWVFARWHAEAQMPDGSPYRNHGVHVVHLRWGRAVEIDANEDSQAVAGLLAARAAAGVVEAAAEPITR